MRITLGKLISHFKGQEHLFINGYFLIIGEERDCFVNLNGHNQLDDSTIIAANNVNNVWYFKAV